MKNVNVKSLGVSYPLSVPTTLEEYMKVSGKTEEEVVWEAANKVILHSTNTIFRSAMADAAEGFLRPLAEEQGLDLASLARQEYPVRDRSGEIKTEIIVSKEEDGNEAIWTRDIIKQETEGDYIKRLEAIFDVDENNRQNFWQGLIDQVMQETDEEGVLVVSFDPAGRKRVAKPKEAPKSYRKTAQAFLDSSLEEANAVAVALEKIVERSGARDENGNITVSGLATLIWEKDRQKDSIAALKKELFG